MINPDKVYSNPILPPRVLIADDYPPMIWLLRRALTPRFQVIGDVNNGAAAIRANLALQPDLIVMDYQMPIIDGIKAARHIK